MQFRAAGTFRLHESSSYLVVPRESGCHAAVVVQPTTTGDAGSPAVRLFAPWTCLLSRAV
jgi:hypothetical protein